MSESSDVVICGVTVSDSSHLDVEFSVGSDDLTFVAQARDLQLKLWFLLSRCNPTVVFNWSRGAARSKLELDPCDKTKYRQQPSWHVYGLAKAGVI
jgi:hypothetical protein